MKLLQLLLRLLALLALVQARLGGDGDDGEEEGGADDIQPDDDDDAMDDFPQDAKITSDNKTQQLLSEEGGGGGGGEEASLLRKRKDEEEQLAATALSLTFRNELSEAVFIYWHSPSGDRIAQMNGETLPPLGAEHKLERTYPGHKFSYDYQGETFYIVAPSKTKQAYAILMGKKEKLTVSCTSSAQSGLEQDVPFAMEIIPKWSPHGAARFLDLVRARYFDGVALNRVVPNFLAQFGIAADYELRQEWVDASIPDDPQLDPPIAFQPGYLSYAGNGKDSRTTEVFVVMPGVPSEQLNYFGENSWETPFGKILGDLEESPVARWKAYGDMPPDGDGPDSQRIYEEDGYEYLREQFPELDYIGTCIVDDDEFAVVQVEEL